MPRFEIEGKGQTDDPVVLGLDWALEKGAVKLTARRGSDKGLPWNLLTIDSKGAIQLLPYIGEELGFDLESEGRLRIANK